MARRVFLMVQDAEGGRVANLSGRRWRQHPSEFWGLEWQAVVARITDGYSRWWLVECENAAAGRRVIEYANRGCEVPPREGSIIASGGRTK